MVIAQAKVALHFEAECDPADNAPWADYDLVIAADGINSRVRERFAEAFGVDIDERANKFVWLGTSKAFEAFTFAFEETAAGWIWAHVRFDLGQSDLWRQLRRGLAPLAECRR